MENFIFCAVFACLQNVINPSYANIPVFCPLKCHKISGGKFGDTGYSYATLSPNWKNARLNKNSDASSLTNLLMCTLLLL